MGYHVHERLVDYTGNIALATPAHSTERTWSGLTRSDASTSRISCFVTQIQPKVPGRMPSCHDREAI